ncbi:MAG: desulfoferrodoxin [Candidatus Kuenenia sp.]|nr:desulfoferrodoxin [Candidatus Kuenenia hertensis]
MRDFDRRKFLKTIGVSSLAIGMAPIIGSLKFSKADEIDWFQNINRVKDPPLSMTPKEKGHVPYVQLPGTVKAGEPFDLDIQIGHSLHPMTPTHYIQWIEIYLGIELVSRIELSPLCPQAKVTIPVSMSKSSTLRVMTRCNLHGIWESIKEVTV